jgi:hypothetical protein
MDSRWAREAHDAADDDQDARRSQLLTNDNQAETGCQKRQPARRGSCFLGWGQILVGPSSRQPSGTGLESRRRDDGHDDWRPIDGCIRCAAAGRLVRFKFKWTHTHAHTLTRRHMEASLACALCAAGRQQAPDSVSVADDAAPPMLGRRAGHADWAPTSSQAARLQTGSPPDRDLSRPAGRSVGPLSRSLVCFRSSDVPIGVASPEHAADDDGDGD